MKCENCGREEVCFHYTSNINGNITEKHLCADCADKLGYASDSPKESEQSFEEIFADLFGMRPNRRMLSGYSMFQPTFLIPTLFVTDDSNVASTDIKPVEKERADVKVEVDEEMKKRREINVLREQMRQAVETEAFEKAAELRDTIKKLENGENS